MQTHHPSELIPRIDNFLGISGARAASAAYDRGVRTLTRRPLEGTEMRTPSIRLATTALILLVGCDPSSSSSGSDTEGGSGSSDTGDMETGDPTPGTGPSGTTSSNPSTGGPGPDNTSDDSAGSTGGPAPECEDSDPPVSCYDGDPETFDVGRCASGVQSCEDGAWTECANQVLPTEETCNGEDDDCDGETDEGCECTPDESQTCYTGPADTQGVGQCTAGIQACDAGSWGDCAGEVNPTDESCNGEDDDCDGDVDEGCDCLPGETQSCYPGPAETEGVGTCVAGTQTCDDSGAWGSCDGATGPADESCNGEDDDCDGDTDELDDPGGCDTGDDGLCAVGVQACEMGGLVCEPNVSPEVEVCDGDDNDCDGETDEGLTDDPILLEGELPDDWSGAVLIASYPGQSSGFVPGRLDTADDVDWFSIFAEEQVFDIIGDTPVSGTVSIQSPGAEFSYRVCACWSTATTLCGKNASGGVASCATSTGGSAQVSVDMSMIQGTTDTGYLDIRVEANDGSEVGCETYDVLWLVSEG